MTSNPLLIYVFKVIKKAGILENIGDDPSYGDDDPSYGDAL